MDIPAVLNGYSFEEKRWSAWTPIFTGFSANPATILSRFMINGKNCFLQSRANSNGTSNATTLTMTLPVKAGANCDEFITGQVAVDNGGFAEATILIGNSGTTLSAYKGIGDGAGFTNSGTKSLSPNLNYEID
jgi:hypothetical protein